MLKRRDYHCQYVGTLASSASDDEDIVRRRERWGGIGVEVQIHLFKIPPNPCFALEKNWESMRKRRWRGDCMEHKSLTSH